MLRTRLTELLGCRVPIQQAPMGSVSSPGLAVAVAEAGGIGTITATGREPEALDRTLAEMAARTDGVLAANFLTASVDLGAVEIAASRVRLVDFFWADPDPELVKVARSAGALVSWQVGSLDEARAAEAAGCDLVVVQGTEAGGHVRGYSPLLPLLASVAAEIRIPVLAAGGIAEPRAFAAVLAAGAAGARIGTRFIATEESGAHPLYKAAVVEAGPRTTEITDAFAVCPLCATSPRTRVLSAAAAAVRAVEAESVGEMRWAGEVVTVPRGFGMPPGAGMTGHIEAMAMYAGESVGLVRAVLPAADVVEELVGGAEELLLAAAAQRELA